MNITRKLELAEAGIESIAQHHDVDGAVRKAALDSIKAKCDAAAEAIDAEVAQKISDAVGG